MFLLFEHLVDLSVALKLQLFVLLLKGQLDLLGLLKFLLDGAFVFLQLLLSLSYLLVCLAHAGFQVKVCVSQFLDFLE